MTSKDPHDIRKEEIEDAMIAAAEDRAEDKLKRGASFHRGKSKQDYGTPDDFMAVVKVKFGSISIDLAADESNTKANVWFGQSLNSLVQPWHLFPGLQFLNPPYSNIDPWAHKCRVESEKGARILFLVPASVGSCWFQMHVHHHAMVYFLRPRLSFDGIAPFPKDCLLAYFGGKQSGYDVWNWKGLTL